MQDLNDKVITNTLSAIEWNEIPTELQNIITATPWVQSLSSGDLNQLGKAISSYAAAGTFYTGGGTANAHTATKISGVQAPPNYHDGMIIRFRPSNANTAAATVNVNSLGIKNIVKENGNILSANEIETTRDCICRYDNSAGNFKLMNYAAQESATPKGYIWGMELSNNVADVSHDIDVSAGTCRDSTDTVTMKLDAAFTKLLDNNGGANGWVAGTDDDGRPVGVDLNGNIWYHVFIVYKTSGGLTDIGFDTDIDATNLLADSGYDYYRRLGAVKTNGSANILQFEQHADNFEFLTPEKTYDVNDPGTGIITVEIDAPLDIVTLASVVFSFNTQGGTAKALIAGHGNTVSLTPSATAPADIQINDTSEIGNVEVRLFTDLLSQIKYSINLSSGSETVKIETRGWIDDRGRTA
jgi:hypothetical protein